MTSELARLGGVLRERRHELGFTQRQLARRCGLTQAAINEVENAHRDPKWTTVVLMFEAMGLEMDVFASSGGRVVSRETYEV